MTDAILTERRDRVLIITMNRPEAKNAINGALATGLLAAVEELNADPSLTAGVLTGAGGAFCSGMDLKGGDDIYDSFRSYQNKLLREYSSMADEFGFRVLDARRPVDVLQDELRRQVQAFLVNADGPQAPEPEPAEKHS